MRIPCLQYKEPMSVSEWAEKNVLLETGRFSYKARPFMRVPTDACSDSNCCRVVIECPAQCGKSSLIFNFIGWMNYYDPHTTLMVLDSMKTANKMAKNKLKPFLRDICKIPSLQRGGSVKDKSASITNFSLKSGANLLLGSANSASDMCSTPAKYLIGDEVSRFPTEIPEEGNPIVLMLKRALTYRGLMILTSTPTTKDCEIHKHFLIGTQETYCAICECGAPLDIDFDRIDFTDEEHPFYICEQCGAVLYEQDVIKLPHKYIAMNDKPFTDKYGRICRSFHFSGTMAHEVYTWKALRNEYIQAAQLGPSSLRSFYNVSLGVPYIPVEQMALSVDALMRCKRYFTIESLPVWCKMLCVGIDCQDTCFKLVVMAADERASRVAFVERKIILGSLKDSPTWDKLTLYLSSLKASTTDGIILKPGIVCIDSGGHFTQEVYSYSLTNPRIKPIKGHSTINASTETALIRGVNKTQLKALGSGVGFIQLTILNVVRGKEIIRENLSKIQSGKTSDWIISSAETAGFDSVFFDEITAEIREEDNKGRIRYTNPHGRRNDFLDASVYCLAAFDIYKLAKGDVDLFRPSKAQINLGAGFDVNKEKRHFVF